MKSIIFQLITFHALWKVSIATFQCGVPSHNINEVVVRGHNVLPGSFPWHTAIYHRNGNTDDYTCGGTLISLKFVLTADHCIENQTSFGLLPPESIFIRLGLHSLNITVQTSQQHEIKEIHQYTDSNSKRKNDIALLELITTAELNDFVQPACINQEAFVAGQYGVAIGWGLNEHDQLSNTLKATRMPILRVTICTEHDSMSGMNLDDSLFCAGYTNGTNVCNGDSGGGLHVKRGSRWYVAGIISFTAKRHGYLNICRMDSYSAFTNVALFVPWIQEVTALKSLSYYGNIEIKLGVNPDPSQQYTNYLPRQCGNYVVNRIIGGSLANLFEFPWIALLAYKINVNTTEYHCQGSLISNRYVLTAAHCFANDFPYQVRLGEYDLSRTIDCAPHEANNCAPPVQDINIESVIRHQSRRSRNRGMYDIALVRLAREATFADHIQPICLPDSDTLRRKKLKQYIITGFGVIEYNAKSNILRKATVPVAKLDDCQKLYNNKRTQIDESHLCAGNGNGRDTCAGDGGGPLGYPVKNNKRVRFVQYGITSFGHFQCGSGPSVYTNVSFFVDWIKANMEP